MRNTRFARCFKGLGELHAVIGLSEVYANVGDIVGPFLGSVLFQYGGFSAPFLAAAALHFLFLLLSSKWLCSTTADKAVDAAPSMSVNLCKVVSPRLLILAGVATLCLGTWGAYEPLLGDHFVKAP